MIIDLLAPAVVLIALVGIVAFMFRAAPQTGGSGLTRLSQYSNPTSLGAFFNGALVAVALASALSSVPMGWAGGALVGGGVALLFAMLSATGPFKETGIQVISGLFGVVGLIVIVALYLDPAGRCAPIPLWERIGLGVLVIAAMAGGALVAVLLGRFRIPSPLAAFGVLKIAIFFSTPLGIPAFALGWPGWAVGFTAALVLGFAGGIAPQFIIPFAGAVIAVAALMVTTLVGTACAAGPNVDDLAPILGFAVVYALLRALVRRFLPS